MKKTLYLFLVAIIFASCGSGETTPEDLGDSSAQIVIGSGNTYNFRFDALNSCNKNCDNLFINTNYREEGKQFTVRFHLKESGAIDKIWYLGDEGIFETSFFDPYDHFKIDNFNFNSEANSLYFEFEGNLFINTLSNSEPLFLKGKVDIPVMKDIECKNYFTNVLTLHNENTRLLYKTANSIIDHVGTPEKSYRYEFYTDNGFRFTLNSEKNLCELPRGEYTFNSADVTNNVMLREFTGLPDISPSFYYKDWTTYETTGSYIITGQLERNNNNVTLGFINIKAFNEKDLKYDFENIYFEAVNIE